MKTNNIQQVCLNRKESRFYSYMAFTFEAPADSHSPIHYVLEENGEEKWLSYYLSSNYTQPHLNMNKGLKGFFFSLHPELSSSVHVTWLLTQVSKFWEVWLGLIENGNNKWIFRQGIYPNRNYFSFNYITWCRILYGVYIWKFISS